MGVVNDQLTGTEAPKPQVILEVRDEQLVHCGVMGLEVKGKQYKHA